MFTTDSRTENFLQAIGVKWKYINGILFPGEFVRGWNEENLGRPVPVRDEAVLEYAALMQASSPAPAPILHNSGTGFRVLDGVQRLSAAQLIDTTRISAYVVQTDSDDVLAVIRVMANARMQGRAEPAEWTRRRAVEVLVVGRKMSAAEVATMGGWKAADIRRIAEAIELQERIRAVGGPDMTDAALTQLRPYVDGKNIVEQASVPLVQFLNTLKQSRISVADSEEFVEKFFEELPRGANPHQTFTKRLEEIKEDPEMRARLTGRQTTEMAKDVVLLRALKSADTIVTTIQKNGDKLPNIDEYFRLIDRITKKLKSMQGKKKP